MKLYRPILMAFRRAVRSLDVALSEAALKQYKRQAETAPYGSLTMYVTIEVDGVEKAGTVYHGTSLDPARDLQTCSTALMFVEAIRERNVDISPWKLYEHLVGHDYNESIRLRHVAEEQAATVTP